MRDESNEIESRKFDQRIRSCNGREIENDLATDCLILWISTHPKLGKRGIQTLELKREPMRLICDYIAGMTDAYALHVYSRLKTTNPATLFRPS
jgi:dGTP triphosphohydrolase